jgi:hypothetical protein
VSALLGYVDDIVKDPHAKAPWLSQKERLAVLAAAERIQEEPNVAPLFHEAKA